MMGGYRKYLWGAALIVVLVTCMIIYLQNVDLRVPEAERNGVVDPATFMTSQQLEKAEDYSRIRYVLYFLQLPYEWLIYLFILILGVSARFQKWVETIFRWSIARIFFFLLLFSLATTLLFLPLDLLGFYLGHKFGITTQSLHSWIQDQIKSYWLNLILIFPTIGVLFWLIKRTKRWWIYAWLLTIPFTIFLYFIQPIILAPLFNEFKPLQDTELKEKILTLAAEADIPAHQVYEVDMSTKTNAMNAYVTGIGSSARIVLWDTTLKKLNHDEILFVMAHEMGHYVKKHVYWSLALSILSSLVFFWVLHLLLERVVVRTRSSLGITEKHDIAIYPIILLLASLLTFASSPLSNWVSRSFEHSSDLYALEMTGNRDAAIRSFQKLSVESLSHPNPPAIVRTLIYTHPTIVERIRFASQFGNETDSERQD